MNKAIISLVGCENSGKTYVLNQVISILMQKTLVSHVVRLRDLKDKTYLIHMGQSLVLVTTLGDANKYLKQELDFAFQETNIPINVIVYAQRSNKKNADFPCIIDLIKNKNYSKVYSTKQVQSDTKRRKVLFNGETKKVDILSRNIVNSDYSKANEIANEIMKYV